jgi:hypothetical protein
MIINHIDNSPEGQKRKATIEAILPRQTLIDSILMPKLDLMMPTLLKMLYAELEIYRAYPKAPLKEKSSAIEELKTFDPRNNTTCFQGKAFKANGNLTDKELNDYRKAIGTFNHSEWGDATLLEIWGGDHFANYPHMVKSAFKYGANITNTKPILKFHINPLFKNNKSGKTKLTPEQKQYKHDMEELLAKAMVFGTKEPKRKR